MTLTFQNLIELFKKTPADDLEFFSAIENSDELGSTITAMANSKGGQIFVGVDFKNFHLKGTDINEEWLKKNIIKYCKPKLDFGIQEIIRNEKKILAIIISGTNSKPYTYNRKCYIRKQGKTSLASLEEEGDMKDVGNAINQQGGLTPCTSPPDQQVPISEPQPTTELEQHTPLAQHAPITEQQPETINQLTDQPTDDQQPTNQQTIIPTDLSSQTTIPEPWQPNKRQKKSLTYLNKHPFIKNKKYRTLYNISHKTAHLELVEMVRQGYFEIKGMGRSTCYVLAHKEVIDSEGETSFNQQGVSTPCNHKPTPCKNKEDNIEINKEELVSSLGELSDLIGEINHAAENTGKPLDENLLSDRKSFLITYLKTNNMISDFQFSELLKIPIEEAKKDLNELVEAGKLSQLVNKGQINYILASKLPYNNTHEETDFFELPADIQPKNRENKDNIVSFEAVCQELFPTNHSVL